MAELQEVEAALAELLDKDRFYGLAFSGGCDSSLLLALLARGGYNVVPYTVKTAFQAPFELADARDAAAAAGTPLRVIEADILSEEGVCANPPNRCYLCKRFIFSRIQAEMGRGERAAAAAVLLDGSNASDDPARRPGMRALAEMGVVSPLRELGLTKGDVRSLSRDLGLFTAEKPNFSCYATKVPAGERIDAAALVRVAEQDAGGWR